MKKTIELKGIDCQLLFGIADANLQLVENTFSSKITVRGNEIYIDGEEEEVKLISELFHEMIQTLSRKSSLTSDDVKQLIKIIYSDNGHDIQQTQDVVHYGKKGGISARSKGQEHYINVVRKNDIVFSIGPAGTGKTYLAVAFAVAALENHEVDKIVLCRPAVEAGENLGFLPGDLKEKVDPYLTPLYDALGEMIPRNRLKPFLEKKIIEIIPLAYMRGRTLSNAFMILDEAQNSTAMQMKMFLTRLGVNSRTIINGDITQIDLPNSKESGLIQATNILKGVDGVGFVQLSEEDVVRHKLVKRIIKAYRLANNK